MTSTSETTFGLPVAIIGAGPVGLAAAAHVVARGFVPLILEAGTSVAANLDSYRQVRLFSPWRYNVDSAAVRLLEASGWTMPPATELPTAGDLIEAYLKPLSLLAPIAAGLRLGHRVDAISREGHDKVKTRGRESAPFLLRTSGGEQVVHRAWAVLDSSGTWSTPNPLGANGLTASGELELADRIDRGMPDVMGHDRARFAGKRTLVVGAGHSAIGTLIALVDLAEIEVRTQVVWAIRGDNMARILGGGQADGLPARGALGERLRALLDSGRLDFRDNFRIRALVKNGSSIDVVADDGRQLNGIDRIVASTGSRPDVTLTRELRVKLDPWIESTEALAPLIDPNVHSCGTVRPHGHRELEHPERNFYVIGAKSYGRAPNFLMATGYEQARSVVAALAGDMNAADDVRPELPETGVCSTDFLAPQVANSCCKPQTPVPDERSDRRVPDVGAIAGEVQVRRCCK